MDLVCPEIKLCFLALYVLLQNELYWCASRLEPTTLLLYWTLTLIPLFIDYPTVSVVAVIVIKKRRRRHSSKEEKSWIYVVHYLLLILLSLSYFTTSIITIIIIISDSSKNNNINTIWSIIVKYNMVLIR